MLFLGTEVILPSSYFLLNFSQYLSKQQSSDWSFSSLLLTDEILIVLTPQFSGFESVQGYLKQKTAKWGINTHSTLIPRLFCMVFGSAEQEMVKNKSVRSLSSAEKR